VLLLGGAVATIVATLLAWVTVSGPSLTLELGLVGAEARTGDRAVTGMDTALWPVLVGLAVVVAALALLGRARRVLLVIGLLLSVAGGLLLFYMANVIDIETRGNDALTRAAADALLTSSVGPGTPLLLGSGLAIVAGAALLRG
jgi:LPXTG-motif cell wall-anchored protein